MIIRVDYQIIKGIEQVFILQLGCAQCHQNMLTTAHFLFLNRKLQFQKVISDGSGQCLICNFQIFVKFIFFQIQKCISKLTDFIVISVNVTATHARKRCRLFLESSL